MNHDERTLRAENASRIMNDPYVVDMLAGIREGLVNSIEGCKWNEHDMKNNLMLSLQLLKSMRTLMNNHILDGRVAKNEIERMNKPKRAWP